MSYSVLAWYEGYASGGVLRCSGNYASDVMVSGQGVSREVCSLIEDGVKKVNPDVTTVVIKHITIFPHD